jgi:uncharacterized protein (TIGR02284 family)
MLVSANNRTPPLILDRLNSLLAVLYESKNIYEQLANTFNNKELSQSVFSLAQESKQYASELSSQIQSLGGVAKDPEGEKQFHQTNIQGDGILSIREKEKATLRYCATHEASMVRAYREVLHEPFLHEGIRKMIRYQLNGILFAFSRLKLLNASLT